jgi:hypothetical protein
VVIVSFVKGYLIWVVGLLAFGMATFLAGCADDSSWGASYGGVELQEDETPSAATGTAPPGSGGVQNVRQNQF